MPCTVAENRLFLSGLRMGGLGDTFYACDLHDRGPEQGHLRRAILFLDLSAGDHGTTMVV
ncbi:MAG TPA: hypothetical protein PK014_07050 [Thermoanaerobaculia bacterium]|nr:hypothetical protein [Thermoanaerobaculia bacterium]HUM29802.1 hypothetical protein [Thermoanaerobaculia bacterium]HXK68077.1 hypothetical protein [Thermoanaerobaculia bacterium]